MSFNSLKGFDKVHSCSLVVLLTLVSFRCSTTVTVKNHHVLHMADLLHTELQLESMCRGVVACRSEDQANQRKKRGRGFGVRVT